MNLKILIFIKLLFFALTYTSNAASKVNSLSFIPSNDSNVVAVLSTTNTEKIINNSVQSNINLSFAFFKSNPQSSDFVSVKKASVNGYDLQNFNGLYIDTTLALHSSPVQWVVEGSNNIPTFNFINTNLMPTYEGYSNIPNSISLGFDFTIATSNANDAMNFSVEIKDLKTLNKITKHKSNEENITFLSGELNSIFNQDSQIVIYIILGNQTTQIIDSKKISFINQLVIEKELIISN